MRNRVQDADTAQARVFARMLTELIGQYAADVERSERRAQSAGATGWERGIRECAQEARDARGKLGEVQRQLDRLQARLPGPPTRC